ncbi:MAG: hypothetical protein LJU34_04535, partial [Oscillospiraceae bacterium]|nr:hypothetical protein [Oscillospiraceae bacterium]
MKKQIFALLLALVLCLSLLPAGVLAADETADVSESSEAASDENSAAVASETETVADTAEEADTIEQSSESVMLASAAADDSAVEPVISPITGDLDSIYLMTGWDTMSNYFDLGENAFESLVYTTVDSYIYYNAGSSFDGYLIDASNIYAGYQIPYELFMEQVDAMFVTYSDMKDFLTQQGVYDAVSDTVTIQYYGGVGDTRTWDAFTTYEDEDYLYVQGIYSSGISEAGDFTLTDDMVENIDYYISESGAHGAITTPIELVLVRSGSGYKIAAWREISYYIIDNVLYYRITSDITEYYYPITVNISTSTNGEETSLNTTFSFDDRTVVSSNPAATVTFSNGLNQYVNGVAWRADTASVTFDITAPDGYTVAVTYSDDVNTDKTVTPYSFGTYEIFSVGGLTIDVTLEAEVVETPAPSPSPTPTAAPSPTPTEAPAASETQAFDLAEVPAGLSYDTVEELEDALTELVLTAATDEYSAENTAVYNVLISTDGGDTWREPTDEDLVNGKITVTLPYPDGTNENYKFTVVHMFTTGDKAGQTETPVATNTADGIQVTLTGLSPVAIAWTESTANTASPAAATTTATATENATAPHTGDDTNAYLWLAFAILCA